MLPNQIELKSDLYVLNAFSDNKLVGQKSNLRQTHKLPDNINL